MEYYLKINIHYEPYTFELENINKSIINDLNEYLGNVESVIHGEVYYDNGLIHDINELVDQLKDENNYTDYKYDDEICNIIDWLKRYNQ